jgi:hypothetical protein
METGDDFRIRLQIVERSAVISARLPIKKSRKPAAGIDKGIWSVD